MLQEKKKMEIIKKSDTEKRNALSIATRDAMEKHFKPFYYAKNWR